MLDRELLDILVCPVSKTPLIYREDTNELISKASGIAFPVRDGIPVLLEEEARHLSDDEIKQL
ncbi:MAG: Trm112 family protein [Alcanivoracaceae bacterium]|nr:Trm112 family protein [Alcanivoracaceae bacterium]